MSALQETKYHREWLLRVLAAVFQFAGIDPNEPAGTRLSKPARKAIARVLLPAESAYRRLVYFIFKRMVGPFPAVKPGKGKADGKTNKNAEPKLKRTRQPVFWLFDKRRYYAELADPSKRVARGPGPRIWFFDERDPPFPPKAEKPARDPDDATRIWRRLLALNGALKDPERQAMRLCRMMEKRAKAPPGPGRVGPVRIGLSPGWREIASHEVDEVLDHCSRMAQEPWPPPKR